MSKGLKFWREEILFSSRLHNGAFRELLLKGIATAFVLKGCACWQVCWCRQTGWWLTKVIRLWNPASRVGWYVFCVWKDNSQEAKAFFEKLPLQHTPKGCWRTGSCPGTSCSNQGCAGMNVPAHQSWEQKNLREILGEWHVRRRKAAVFFGKEWKQFLLCWEEEGRGGAQTAPLLFPLPVSLAASIPEKPCCARRGSSELNGRS